MATSTLPAAATSTPAANARFAAPVRRAAGRAVAAWRTTPGRLRAIRAFLVLLILLAGGLATYAAGVRVAAARHIDTRSEPLSSDAIDAYRSLADADVMAASGFLPGASPTSTSRVRYDKDIEQAAASLTHAAARSGGDSLTSDRISDITAALPVYSGLVEGARADRSNGSLEVADFEEASELMHSTLLRRAQALQRDETGRLGEEYDRALVVPQVVLVCGLLTLVALLVVQAWLFRRTRRILNVGLAVATAVVAGLTLWWAVALSVSQDHLADSRRHSRSVTDALGQAQIAARQARASEILALVADPGRAAFYDEQFSGRAQRLARADGAGGALGAARHLSSTSNGPALVETAVDQAEAWMRQHDRVSDLSRQGRHDEAVAAAVGPAATAFDQLDNTLTKAVDGERDAFREDIDTGRRALRGLVAGTLLLAFAAAVAAARGLGQRLEEYR